MLNKDLFATITTKIDAPTGKVWRALTDPEIIKQYLFGTDAKSSWKVGEPITFSGAWEGKFYEDKGTVLQIEPEKVLQYSYWSNASGVEDRPENYTIVNFELTPEGDSTILKLTQTGAKDEEAIEHSKKNWQMVMEGMKKILENNS